MDDFNENVCRKLECIYPDGSYSIVEWINQYQRQGWFTVINNVSKQHLNSIITQTKYLNQNEQIKCSICDLSGFDKIWV